ncbi:hypothetical protein ABZ114_22525 [Streptomyces albidoflavus]|uniref:hypothetical protein n=1 Tax=Streptomyces albidoflavus TaxID=1886 RepID=UPI0033A4AE66
MTPEPLAATGLFRAVMDAADWRCQCTGHCGNTHARSESRCSRRHNTNTPLTAAPADPLTPLVQAVTLPAADLMAWCPACHTGALRQARKDARRPDLDQGALFD